MATQRTVSRAASRAHFSSSASAAKSCFVRHLVEAANPHIDGMDLPAAEQAHDLVAGLLQPQAALHLVGVVLGHADGVFVAEKVGRVQQINVQRVALDPFAAVDQPAQVADGAADFDAAGVLHGMAGAHLIGDRTDAADAGGDVGRLMEFAAPQKRLEEARRLEDLQLDVRHLLALDLHQAVRLRLRRAPGSRL